MTKPDASLSAASESMEKVDVQTVDEKPPAEPTLEQQQQQREHTSEASDGLAHKDASAASPEQTPSADDSNIDNNIQPAKDNDGGASTTTAAAGIANAASDTTVSGNISSETPGPSAHVVEADTVTPAALATAAVAARTVDGETQHTAPPSPPSLSSPHLPHLPMPGKMIRRTSTSSSSSKVHDAIQDIISQFDPLKVSASAAQLPEDSDAPTSSTATTTNTQQTASTDPATTTVDAENRRRQQADLRSKFEPETDGFNYNDFLQQLRHPAAKPVARTVKNFLTEFSRRPMTLSEQVRFVHDFLVFVAGKMRECTIWQSMGDREFDNAREGMEKLVMNRLYHLCFSPSTSDDSDKDHVISEKMSLFRWIRAEHLDIQQTASASATESFLQFARTELLKINSFKSPRDKVICILNCCTVIYALLRTAKEQQEDKAAGTHQQQPVESDVGADRFLPILIYVVIMANPPKLVSNLQYIMRFRSADRMQSEAGYYVTNLQGAVAFIESMDASCLSIAQDEFDRNIEMTIWEMEMEKRNKERSKQSHQRSLSLNQPSSVSHHHEQHRQHSNMPLPRRPPSQKQRDPRQQQQQQHHQQHMGDSESGGERAQWLIDRSSDFAKSTIEKTNNFVGRLISEFSTPATADSGDDSAGGSSSRSYPGRRPLNASESGRRDSSDNEHPQHRHRAETSDEIHVGDAELVGQKDWKANMMIVRDMFPNIDADVVEIVFESNNGVVPRTIEQLLDMSATNEALEVAKRQQLAEDTNTRSEYVVVGTQGEEELQGPRSLPEGGRLEEAAGTGKRSGGGAGEALGGEDDVDEMERWKGQWADDDSDADDEGSASVEIIRPKDAAVSPGPSDQKQPTMSSVADSGSSSNNNAGDNAGTIPKELQEHVSGGSSEQGKADSNNNNNNADDDGRREEDSTAAGSSSHVQDNAPERVPDTSGDEELARKLQLEFEQQARQEEQQPSSHPPSRLEGQ
ncbi:hypothetical protein IWW48_000055 [Coemansia sp. RSA 1200]|nr:hypothetical protein IWW48_000055 [Coemansia sp. RSA 1200]